MCCLPLSASHSVGTADFCGALVADAVLGRCDMLPVPGRFAVAGGSAGVVLLAETGVAGRFNVEFGATDAGVMGLCCCREDVGCSCCALLRAVCGLILYRQKVTTNCQVLCCQSKTFCLLQNQTQLFHKMQRVYLSRSLLLLGRRANNFNKLHFQLLAASQNQCRFKSNNTSFDEEFAKHKDDMIMTTEKKPAAVQEEEVDEDEEEDVEEVAGIKPVAATIVKPKKKQTQSTLEDEHLRKVARLVNEQIPNRFKTVRLLDVEGKQVGEMSRLEAVQRAKQSKVDLMLINDKVTPIVCRLGNYVEYGVLLCAITFCRFLKGELDRFREAEKLRKKQLKESKVKEIKLRTNIQENDLLLKVQQARKYANL